ncbi:MAG: aminopeptidase [Bacilli bacterium]|nr:aminopeptidase [Bacilli bacterium]MDD4608245.1 aminopeptidase [Bacilli bacterium]
MNINNNDIPFLNDKINIFSQKYINFLNNAKTEREIINSIKDIAKKNGFKEISNFKHLKAGDKVYYISKEKNIYLAIIGEESINNGLNIIAAHSDSPRLDLKPNPLYEHDGLAYFKTHYYGCIKKYQWTTIPLAIHGVIAKTNGDKITIVVGENEEDPVMVITDLLPHLADEQMEEKMKDAITGEALNLLVGNIPIKNQKIDAVKINILNILKEKYDISEMDFTSAEIEVVPAFKSREVGLDRSMIGGYGQDDRSSVFNAVNAIINIKKAKKTAVCIITDKEEIGSLGNTSINSKIFDLFISEIYYKLKNNEGLALNHLFCNSKLINAEVDIAMDPIYEFLFEKNNAFFLGKGVTINKYSGSNGKDNCSDANAEYVAFIRKLLEENNISYQVGEGGKVDAGGGGTNSFVFANKGSEAIDCGVPILSMHSPYEVISKYDLYMAYTAYKVFFESY